MENGFSGLRFPSMGQSVQGIAVGSRLLLSLPFPWESVSGGVLCLILCRVLHLGFGELLAPQNQSQQHRCTPILQQEGKSIKSSLQFCGAMVLRRMGFLCTRVRDDAEKCKYIFFIIIFFFPPFSSYLALPPSCRW